MNFDFLMLGYKKITLLINKIAFLKIMKNGKSITVLEPVLIY
jgi:hypothetical protein